MTIIKLGFLLGILQQQQTASSTKNETTKSKENVKGRDKLLSDISKIKPKRDTESKLTKERKKSFKSEELTTEKSTLPDYAFEVDKPKGYFHIEYTLAPHLKPCHIDIVHWDVISKIYSDNTTAIYKNLIINGVIWIPIMIEHKISKEFTKEELLNLPNLVIDFVVSSEMNKLGSDAKFENCKIFFVKATDISSDCYVEAFESDPNIGSPKRKKSSKVKKTRFSMDQPLHTVLHQFDRSLLHPCFIKMLRKLQKHEPITFKHYIPPSIAPGPESLQTETINDDDANNFTWPIKEKKSQMTITAKKSKIDTEPKHKKAVCVKVSGESLFTDAARCTYRLNEEVEVIHDLFVVFSTYNLTTPEIMRELNPLVIKLKTLKNLPVEHLINENFSSIYLQYNIPNVAKHASQPIKLKDLDGKNIKVNESRVFFEVAMPELTCFLMSNRLIVELIGVYSKDSDLRPSLFGSERYDFVKCPPRPQDYIYPKPSSLILGVACYDLSLMVQGILDLQLEEPIRHPTNSLSQSPKYEIANEKFRTTININQISFSFKKDHHPSPLSDGILFANDTSLKIQVCLHQKITRMEFLPDPVQKYKRFLLICYKVEVAESILSNVLYYNQQFLNSVVLPNYYMYNKYVKEIPNVDPQVRAVTGFWIDCGNAVVVFLEGSITNYCMEIIIEQVRVLNESLCRLYHNTALQHYNRIYENFLAFGGIYKITTKYPFKDIFGTMFTHMSKYVPKPAYEALKKLELMFEMQSSNIMNQHAIYPTVNELISFNIEFGVSHKCCSYI